MTTLSTHDTKRGEDVRARIGVLSQVPGAVGRARSRTGSAAPRRPTRPPDCSVAEHLRGVAGRRNGRRRAAATTARVRREGRSARPHLHTRWTDPDSGVRGGGARLARRGDRRPGRRRAHRVGRPSSTRTARSDALGQKLLRSPCPEFPTSIRAPNCGRTAWSTRTTAGRSTSPCAGATRWKPLDAPQDPGGRGRRCELRRDRPRTLPGGRLHPGTGRRGRRRARRRVPARRRVAGRGQPLDGAPRRNRLGRHSSGTARRILARPSHRRVYSGPTVSADAVR